MTKEEFLDKLDKDKILEDLSVILKRDTLPLIMWGCGDIADSVFQYLDRNGICVSGVFVDSENVEGCYRNMKIESLDEILEKYDEFNIILGHSQYDKGNTLKLRNSKIKNVFYMFSASYEQYEKVNYAEIENEVDRFIQLCDHLEDKQSITNLLAYLNTKMTGNAQYILDVFNENMSFYNNDIYKMSDHEVFFDIGAYNGDSLKLFLEETQGLYKKIIALEPDDKSFLELNNYIASKRLKNIVASKLGAWNKREDLKFRTGNEQISSLDMVNGILESSEVITIYADKMDTIFGNEDISFIKINYFVGVLEAIEGSEKIICDKHPKLAIDVGFDIYNVLKISEYLRSLDLGYKLYLRINRAMSSTFTLYAVV